MNRQRKCLSRIREGRTRFTQRHRAKVNTIQRSEAIAREKSREFKTSNSIARAH